MALLCPLVELRLSEHVVSLCRGEPLGGRVSRGPGCRCARLLRAEKPLDAAVRRSEAIVRSDYVDEVLRGLADVGAEGWQVLSVQVKHEVFDVVIDRVIVYPKEHPRGHGQGPHKIKILWR